MTGGMNRVQIEAFGEPAAVTYGTSEIDIAPEKTEEIKMDFARKRAFSSPNCDDRIQVMIKVQANGV